MMKARTQMTSHSAPRPAGPSRPAAPSAEMEPDAPARSLPATKEFDLSARLGVVGSHMSRTVVTIGRRTPLVEACRLMTERRIGCVVVVDGDGAPVGLVSER